MIESNQEVVFLQIDKLRGEQLDQLFKAILSLDRIEECYRFFDDIATMNEIQSISQRLQVAKMLTEGKTYSAIEQETNASTATISRVRRCIDYGSGGYELVLDRMANQQEDSSRICRKVFIYFATYFISSFMNRCLTFLWS